MRELKAHRDEQEAVSYFYDRNGFTVQPVNPLEHDKASTEKTTLPSRIPSYRFPSHYWSVGVGL